MAVQPIAAPKGARAKLTLVRALTGVDFPMAIELVPFGEGLRAVFAVVGPLGALSDDNISAAGAPSGGRDSAQVGPAIGIDRFDGYRAQHGEILLLGVGVHGLLLAGVLSSGHSLEQHSPSQRVVGPCFFCKRERI